ncbi:putative phage tail protein [Clostridium frigidicarnis]|uniref:DUF2313 domain-containing protein n=1 Tax=Clostridium frigidicarnis TaxID=84698 RepID=A0A1I0V137_9CLOT|nr:putative phage tail protein [Clostridium frigidicarnis]SFA70011.1 hypothetical protein SAMN04488528_100180 [Clostridium frigidicarnis]
MKKEQLLNNLHKLYRKDPWLNELFKSTGLTLDEAEKEIDRLYKQYWFDTVDEDFLPLYEKLLGIKSNHKNDIEDRRALVEAKWKSSGGKCDLDLIQAVANSWKNGSVNVEFIEGKINLKFIGEHGVPKDLKSLIEALDDIKPAHLALMYTFAYFLIEDIHNKMTIEELQTHTIEEFAFNTLVIE